MRTRLAAATVAASLIGGGVAGALVFTPTLAAAQDAAEEDGGGDATGLGTHIRSALDPLVADATITAAQADAVTETLVASGPDGGRRRGAGHLGHGARLDTLAEALGLGVDELRAALGGGQTLAEVAEANGSSVEALVDELLAALDERLADVVAEGDLTQVEADERRSTAEERITAMVEGEAPFGRGFGRFGGGPHDERGDDLDDAA